MALRAAIVRLWCVRFRLADRRQFLRVFDDEEEALLFAAASRRHPGCEVYCWELTA